MGDSKRCLRQSGPLQRSRPQRGATSSGRGSALSSPPQQGAYPYTAGPDTPVCRSPRFGRRCHRLDIRLVHSPKPSTVPRESKGKLELRLVPPPPLTRRPRPRRCPAPPCRPHSWSRSTGASTPSARRCRRSSPAPPASPNCLPSPGAVETPPPLPALPHGGIVRLRGRGDVGAGAEEPLTHRWGRTGRTPPSTADSDRLTMSPSSSQSRRL